MVEDRDVEADRFPRQRLNHQTRGARSATRRPADLIVVRLVAQHAAEAILRDRQTHELQGSERARRTHRLHVSRVLVHGAPGAESVGHRPKIVAPPGAIGGVEGLLVGTGARRRATVRALACDDDIDVAPLQFDRRPQPGGAAAEHQRLAAMDGHRETPRRHHLLRRSFRLKSRHGHVGQSVEDRLGDRAQGKAAENFKLPVVAVASAPASGLDTHEESFSASDRTVVQNSQSYRSPLRKPHARLACVLPKEGHRRLRCGGA